MATATIQPELEHAGSLLAQAYAQHHDSVQMLDFSIMVAAKNHLVRQTEKLDWKNCSHSKIMLTLIALHKRYFSGTESNVLLGIAVKILQERGSSATIDPVQWKALGLLMAVFIAWVIIIRNHRLLTESYYARNISRLLGDHLDNFPTTIPLNLDDFQLLLSDLTVFLDDCGISGDTPKPRKHCKHTKSYLNILTTAQQFSLMFLDKNFTEIDVLLLPAFTWRVLARTKSRGKPLVYAQRRRNAFYTEMRAARAVMYNAKKKAIGVLVLPTPERERKRRRRTLKNSSKACTTQQNTDQLDVRALAALPYIEEDPPSDTPRDYKKYRTVNLTKTEPPKSAFVATISPLTSDTDEEFFTPRVTKRRKLKPESPFLDRVLIKNKEERNDASQAVASSSLGTQSSILPPPVDFDTLSEPPFSPLHFSDMEYDHEAALRLFDDFY